MDVEKNVLGRERVRTHGGTRSTRFAPEEYAVLVEANGAGEIIVQSIPRDGTMEGYDLELVGRISRTVTIPVVALGGAGSLEDLRRAHREAHASGLAAGSLFVFQGPRRGVLINYPERSEVGF